MKKQIIEKPILFRSEMTNALLKGRKTVTRRLVDPQPPEYVDYLEYKNFNNSFWGYMSPERLTVHRTKPKYWPGLLLWVKETWGIIGYSNYSGYEISVMYSNNKPIYDIELDDEELWEKIVKHEKQHENKYQCSREEMPILWRSSLFIPRVVSRIHLKITDVKIERLHELDDIDAMLEGCKNREDYARLWNEINKKGGILWEANPWVYRIQFEVLPEMVSHD